MSELTLFLIRAAFLAILWIFVLSAISVIRSDMFGARVPETARGAAPAPERRKPAKANKKPRRGAPTHLLVVEGENPGTRAERKARSKQQKSSKPRRGVPTQVVIVEGGNKGEAVSLEHAPLLIGRGNDAAIRLDDDYVSTRHARIAASGDEWFVEDLGSTNGTYVGPVRITQPTTIGLGVQVRVGKTILELRK